ncbi:serine/threonine-protein kinase [Streptomyces sp. NPDC004752]
MGASQLPLGESGLATPLTAEDPERLGGYWLAARLGVGGQGVVYEAYDAGGARGALKTLHQGAEPAERGRFWREAEAARRVASFCTARILDVSVAGYENGPSPWRGHERPEDWRPGDGQGGPGDVPDALDGIPFIVSEYVPGPTLAAEVRQHGPLTADALLRLATGVATALAAIHSADVVHRDLKPGNVLLGPDGPRIIDFGIARAADMSLTASGAIMGTFGYRDSFAVLRPSGRG